MVVAELCGAYVVLPGVYWDGYCPDLELPYKFQSSAHSWDDMNRLTSITANTKRFIAHLLAMVCICCAKDWILCSIRRIIWDDERSQPH